MRIGRVEFGGSTEPAIYHQQHWVRSSICASAVAGSGVVDLLMARDQLQHDLNNLDLTEALEMGDAVAEEIAQLAVPIDSVHSIIAVGLNYREHAEEVNLKEPSTPLTFAKWPSSLTGPRADILLDRSISTEVDHEVELAVIIGKHTIDVAVADALNHVAGYAVANDLSARDVQFAEKQWTRAKSFDGFCPLGPWITSADQVPDPQRLRLSCSVNGKLKQNSSTDRMIFSVAQLISFASTATTLEPGDLLLTGTPAGVAMGSERPEWLRPGDVVRCEIESLGMIENRMVERLTTI